MSKDDQKLFGINKLNKKRSSIPAVTHVDYSARVQTVHKETNPRYYKLLEKFKKITECPVLVNTSFNVRGEPIVCTIEDAFRCFMGTNLDLLVLKILFYLRKNSPKICLKNIKMSLKMIKMSSNLLKSKIILKNFIKKYIFRLYKVDE